MKFLDILSKPGSTKSRKTGKLFLGDVRLIRIGSQNPIANKLGALKFERVNLKNIGGIVHYLNRRYGEGYI